MIYRVVVTVSDVDGRKDVTVPYCGSDRARARHHFDYHRELDADNRTTTIEEWDLPTPERGISAKGVPIHQRDDV